MALAFGIITSIAILCADRPRGWHFTYAIKSTGGYGEAVGGGGGCQVSLKN